MHIPVCLNFKNEIKDSGDAWNTNDGILWEKLTQNDHRKFHLSALK